MTGAAFPWTALTTDILVTPADPAADRARAHARWNPERETLELAAAGAAKVLGADHGATKAFARASITMAKADLWQARLAVKTLRLGRCAVRRSP